MAMGYIRVRENPKTCNNPRTLFPTLFQNSVQMAWNPTNKPKTDRNQYNPKYGWGEGGRGLSQVLPSYSRRHS